MKFAHHLMAGAAAVAIMVAAHQPAFAQTQPTEEQAPATEQAPAATEEAAPAPEQAPAETEEAAPAPEQAPAATEEAAPAPEQAPAATEEAAPAPEQAPAATEEAAPAPEQAPAATEEAAPAPEQAPAATEEAAPAPEQAPATEEAAPAPEQAPAATDQQAEQPAKKDRKKKKAAEEQPAATEQAPAVTEQAPATGEQAPAAGEQAPAVTEQAPATGEQAPAATGEAAPAQPQTEEGTPAQAQQVEQDPTPQFTADTVLGDDRPPAELTNSALRDRIRAAEELSANDQTPRRQRRDLQQKMQADQQELNARIAASTGVSVGNMDVSAKVNEVTSDNRDAGQMTDDELRNRIQETRGLLATEGLDDQQRKQLTGILQADRREIRSRVATRGNEQRRDGRNADRDGDGDDRRRSNDLPMRGDQLTLRDLMEDQRAADDLTARALERRIEANRRALRIDSLNDRQRERITNRIRDDRQALRDRYGNRRDRRRDRLNDPAFALAIAAGAIASAAIRSRPNIAAAEAYDEELEDWLTAPPLVESDRRYTVEQFRERPRLRYSVPGIELDTVSFGFGEAFIREEELPQLERLGSTIERIVAGSPDEVFLIEGHTDAVGTEAANMKLSQERADAVKQSLMEYFSISDENLATVGRGELYPKIPTEAAEAENRRVSIRRITPLLARQ